MSALVSPTIVSMDPSRVSPILQDTIWAPAGHQSAAHISNHAYS
jgi:hypothetical protein